MLFQHLGRFFLEFLLSRLALVWVFLIFLAKCFLKLFYSSFYIGFSGHTPRKAEVTNFDRAIVVYEDIGWLQVSMDDIGRVNEVDGAKDVVQNSDYVVFFKLYFC
jgi:hypothetical protein